MLKSIVFRYAVALGVMAMTTGKPLLAADGRAASSANDQYRVMNGTLSPNGRYELALGLDEEKIDWKSLYQKPAKDAPGYYEADPDKDDKIIRNYVVDLKTARMLGVTGGRYYSTRKLNTQSCDVAWSPDSSIFIQVIHWKWYSYCRAGRISAGKLAGAIDLQASAEKFAYKFLADQQDKAFLKHNNEFETTVESFPWGGESKDLLKAGNDGVIELKLSGVIPHSSGEDSSFEVVEHLRLTGKMDIELVDIRYAH